jgi:tRNA A37 threonylcarbamoyladenosine biosynthesis protein TsaE
VDAFRLSGKNDVLFHELAERAHDPSSVLVIEWADRVATQLPAPTMRIDIAIAKNEERRITIS